MIAALIVLTLLGLHWISALLVIRRFDRPAADLPAGPLPRISLIRPVCGLDTHDPETFATSFDQIYPDWELVFCVARADDPAIPVLRRLIAAHPQVEARLMIGDHPITRNPKLNNLWQGWNAAEGEFVVLSDCNVLLPPDYLHQVLAAWQADTGLVSAPPVGVRAKGLWGAVEAAFLNGNQARLQLAADELGFGFAQGKTLMWRKADLDDAGGLALLGQDLAEDVNATKVVRAAGRTLVLTSHPFAQPIGARSLRAVWLRQLRWSKVRRDGFPLIFLLEPLNGGLVPVLLAGLAWGPLGALALASKWYGAELFLSWRAGWPLGRWGVLAMVLRDLMIPILWLATFGSRGFEWRGTTLAKVPTRSVAPRQDGPGAAAFASAE